MSRRPRAIAAASGLVLLFVGTVPGGPAEAGTATPPDFVAAFGTAGSGNGQFNQPIKVAVTDDTVYVVDRDNARIQHFDRSGAYQGQWGGFGSDPGELDGPSDIEVAADGDVYIADSVNRRIQVFSPTGTFLDEWGQQGTADGEFQFPVGLSLDSAGNVYVIDSLANEVQVFDASGTFLDRWGGPGSGDGQFSEPYDIDVGAAGRVFVADTANHRIQELTTDGTFVAAWGGNGSGEGEFFFPQALDVRTGGRVAVADTGNDRLQVLTDTGDHLATIGEAGTGDGQFESPTGVAATTNGELYVADADNNRIQRFAEPRPDARVRRGNGTTVGNGIYNTTTAGQRRDGTARRGASVNYWISMQNDSALAAPFRVRGQGSSRHFTVRYLAGSADVTAAVVAGTYQTATVQPGAIRSLRAVVTVRNSAPAGSSIARTVTVRSTTTPPVRDAVRFTTRRI